MQTVVSAEKLFDFGFLPFSVPQRTDIAMAITKNDMFDFLIDIVPREEIQIKTKTALKVTPGLNPGPERVSIPVISSLSLGQ